MATLLPRSYRGDRRPIKWHIPRIKLLSLARSGWNHKLVWLAGGAAIFVAALFSFVYAAHHPDGHLVAFGPIDEDNGYPEWYEDSTGLRLAQCIDPDDPLCGPLTDELEPPGCGPVDFPGCFPAEFFWWSAEAAVDGADGSSWLLVLAMEAAFGGEEEIAEGNQITFGRVRIRARGAPANAEFTVTHPFGVDVVQADDTGRVRMSEDIGCAVTPCDFAAAFESRVGPFLVAVSPAPPAGYVGDPNVSQTVSGSPFGTNFFSIEGDEGVIAETDEFSVMGKIFSGDGEGDGDGDGVPNAADNCPETPNEGQEDGDGDGVGDACDNCPATANPGQENEVHPDTPAGDACEDPDDDGVFDATDNCPDTANSDQTDLDSDGVGDVCDNCPVTANAGQENSDGDELGDACDPDSVVGTLTPTPTPTLAPTPTSTATPSPVPTSTLPTIVPTLPPLPTITPIPPPLPTVIPPLPTIVPTLPPLPTITLPTLQPTIIPTPTPTPTPTATPEPPEEEEEEEEEEATPTPTRTPTSTPTSTLTATPASALTTTPTPASALTTTPTPANTQVLASAEGPRAEAGAAPRSLPTTGGYPGDGYAATVLGLAGLALSAAATILWRRFFRRPD